MSTRSSGIRSSLLAALVAAWPALPAAQSVTELAGSGDELTSGGPGDPPPAGGGSDTLLDFDGEGRSDILLRNRNTNECLLWLMRGGQILALVPLPDLDDASAIVGNGDYDGNGFADLLQHDAASGDVTVTLIEGSAPSAEGRLATIGPDSAVVGSGDYDGDGTSEVVVHNRDTGVVEFWDLHGAEIVDTRAVPDSKGGHWSIVGSGDFDGDADDDLLWHDASSGRLHLWLLQDLGLVDEAALRDRVRAPWRVVGTGHYTDDHLADILIHDDAKGRLAVLRTRFTAGQLRANRLRFDERPGPGRAVVHSGDFDSDGVLEIVLHDARSGSVEMWFATAGKVQATANLGPLEPDWFLAGIGLESAATHRASAAATSP